MNPRIRRILTGVVIGLAVLASGIWVLSHALRDSETLYRGKSLDYWIEQTSRANAAVSNEAVVVIEAEIIPGLVNTMFNDRQDSTLRMMLVDWLSRLPGVELRVMSADTRRVAATEDLGSLGPRAGKVIPELIKVLKGNDGPVRAAAARSLGQIHGEPETVIPLLITCFDDPQEGVPAAAVEAIGGYGSLAKEVVPRLEKLVEVHDKDMRRAASLALKQIDPELAAKKGLR